jgi:short-subunit dehydrogenase
MGESALVTGATAGIGASFARLLASKGYHVVLVARDEERLIKVSQELATDFGMTSEVLRADLSTAVGLKLVADRLASTTNPIGVLINNAGFGINKSFLVSDLEAEQNLLDVLVTAPMRLMHAVLPVMKEHDRGIIINVSSVAGWIAGGTYSAAKSYLTVLSESLHTELAHTRVTVMALCPGFTRTEFHERGRMKMGGLPNFMWLSADYVVNRAWSDARRGQALSVPGWQYAVLSTVSRFGPRPLVRKIGMNVRKKQRHK